VKGEQPGSGGPRGSPGEPRRHEINGKHAQNRPDAHGPPCAGQAVDSVADRNGSGEKVWELPDDASILRILNEEAHETQRVVVGSTVRGEEQIAGERRHRGHHRIVDDNRAPLRDLNALVHVGSRILTTNDVFRRREESPQPETDNRDREDRGPGDGPRCAS
jgi:hypothetical protein